MQHFAAVPSVVDAAVLGQLGSYMAAVTDPVRCFAAGKFPRVTVVEPGFRRFSLPAVLDDLAKQAVVVANAITISGDVESGHAFHEAGGKAAKTAIAECGVGLKFFDKIQIDIQVGQGLLECAREFEIAECVAQQAANEEFE